MDIVVHPSRREGLARALPQGSLARKPVITYDIDGAKEGVLDGQTGFVVPPFDKVRLGDALKKLLDDPSLRSRMGDAGQQFAQARFGANAMVEGLEAVYQSALLNTRQFPGLAGELAPRSL